jgi:hypothetical protein
MQEELMSHALVASASPVLDLAAMRELGRASAALLKGALQVAGFAVVLWLIAAGPGCLSDSASTVAAHVETGR